MNRTCSETDCGKQATVRGLCPMHYQRARKTGDLPPPIGRVYVRNTCTVEDCGRFAFGHGLCNMHYVRMQRHGTTEAAKRPSLEERFWSKVEKGEACWLWRAKLDTGGYGIIAVNQQNKKAHRIAYELLVGAIPEGMFLDHLCRVRACVNPLHLEPVTRQENMHRARPWHPNRAKTHCPQGHPYEGDNVRMRPGHRKCRACERERAQRARAQKRRAE